ncbi:MAG: multiheme c-type cytochrome [Vicinamibacteria bacterium]
MSANHTRARALGAGIFGAAVGTLALVALLGVPGSPAQGAEPLAAADACAVFDPLRTGYDPAKLDEAQAKACEKAIRARASAQSAGCLTCHVMKQEDGFGDRPSMHEAARIGCTDCHGGRADVKKGDRPDEEAKRAAHDLPPLVKPELWTSSANPERSYSAILHEDLRFVRFVNPGDLRVAGRNCAPCHGFGPDRQDQIVRNVHMSAMTHGGMLYAAALYNNGVVPFKNGVFGESYDPATGKPRILRADSAPSAQTTLETGELGAIWPFPRWELGQTGNPFRVFERGGRRRLEIGLPDLFEEPGKPDKGLSPRGPGTFNRTDPLILGAQKTRLVDPLLSLLGTNDHPGDYRSSGCSACHVLYANDRSPANSGRYAAFGNRARSQTSDPTIPKNESGHPLKHTFTTAIPSSQCMTCHMHPGTNMVTTYLGYTWWDNEADASGMYRERPGELSSDEQAKIEAHNPEGAALRGKWGDPEYLAEVSGRNALMKTTQFADFHGHGWIFRGVYRKDRKGTLLDGAGKPIADDDPAKFRKAVHLQDIHLEKGMHCVDCHFEQDNHGNGKLYNEPRSAVEIDCADCHGTPVLRVKPGTGDAPPTTTRFDRPASLVATGPAAPAPGLAAHDLRELKAPGGSRFEVDEQLGVVLQRSLVEPGRTWRIPPTTRAGQSALVEESHDPEKHPPSKVTCYACHTAWTTSCFGCHLSMRANEKKPNLHNEGGDSRNWTSYNFQTLRDDIFFLARDGSVGPLERDEKGEPLLGADGKPVRLGNRIAPARSACAILVSSQNQNREWIYSQQQTVSGGGYSGQAFSTFVPHTVRGKGDTKLCTDCHVSADDDNNAWLASLVMQGTGLMNFVGRYAYVGEESHGFEAVAVTERSEPQAVIGSDLHQLAYPGEFAAFTRANRQLREGYHHGGDVRSLQLRGEYLFAAQGKDGLRVYDVAQIDHKGFSERMVSAPVSPLGQKLYVKTRNATSVALPATMTVDPSRPQLPANQEQPIHPLYDHAFVTDAEEGLIVVGPLHELLDGDPRNNFLARVTIEGKPAFNPDGALTGATSLTLAGTVGFVTTPRGVVILDLDVPARPRLVATVSEGLREPRAVAVQFRYAFVADAEGLKVLDVQGLLYPSDPRAPRAWKGKLVASAPVADARSLYLARTYAYLAAGSHGLAIVDIERPQKLGPDKVTYYTAEGRIGDAHDVKIGFTNGSGFAYVADGRNGLHVVQIISANGTPGAYGFSPKPQPTWIATYHTHGPAVALSRGLDRDRAVDETGNQIAVFGRRGARPLAAADVLKLLKRQRLPEETGAVKAGSR